MKFLICLAIAASIITITTAQHGALRVHDTKYLDRSQSEAFSSYQSISRESVLSTKHSYAAFIPFTPIPETPLVTVIPTAHATSIVVNTDPNIIYTTQTTTLFLSVPECPSSPKAATYIPFDQKPKSCFTSTVTITSTFLAYALPDDKDIEVRKMTCDLKGGQPNPRAYLKRVTHHRAGWRYTLRDCYKVCKNKIKDCQSYNWYYEEDTGGVRCDMYKKPVAESIQNFNWEGTNRWFDLQCGMPPRTNNDGSPLD